MRPTHETRRITIELDPETWSRIQTQARLDGRTPASWITETVQNQSRPGYIVARDLGLIVVGMVLCLGLWTWIASVWFRP